MKPICYIFVGVPGSGKSTFANEVMSFGKMGYASTDEWIDLIAQKSGMTYNEAFKDNMPDAITQMLENVKLYIANNESFIWDQTSVTVKSRRKKLVMIPNTYRKIAVVFRTPDAEELQWRLNSRKGKTIPPHVMKSMIESYVEPTLEEGFDKIVIMESK